MLEKIFQNKELVGLMFFILMISVLFVVIGQVSAGAKVITISSSTSDNVIFNGKIGIGTSTPIHDLHIYDTSANAEIDIQSVAGVGNHWAIYNERSNNSLRFWNDSIRDEKNLITLLTTNRVGIGTTTPGAYKLSINGALQEASALSGFFCNGTAALSGSFSNTTPVSFTLCGGLWTNVNTVAGASRYLRVGNGTDDCNITFVKGVLTETQTCK